MVKMASLTTNFYTLICLLSVTFPVFGEVPCAPVTVRPCPGEELSPKATLVRVYISDCFEEPCNFNRGQNVTMEMDIRFHDTVNTMTADLYAMIGTGIPWDGVNKEACEDIVSEKNCPFKSGDYISYGVDLFVEPVYPQIRTDVRYRLHDEDGKLLICWIVKAQVR